MPSEADIYPALSEVFAEAFQRPVALHPGLTARDVPGWDSFKQIEIVMAAEERFAVRFTIREFDSLQSVGDLVRTIAAKTQAARR